MERLVTTIEESQGPDKDLRDLFEQTMKRVAPRLLRPLETGGRQIKPSLVDGDLYSGNVSVDVEYGRPILYDATCPYAHNECKTSQIIALLLDHVKRGPRAVATGSVLNREAVHESLLQALTNSGASRRSRRSKCSVLPEVGHKGYGDIPRRHSLQSLIRVLLKYVSTPCIPCI